MSSFITKTSQKVYEFDVWIKLKELLGGANVTKDEFMESRKAEVNQIDQYFHMLQ